MMEFEIMFNACYGGFSVSKEAIQCYLDSNGYVFCPYHICRGLERTDPSMIEIVKQLGARANGKCADIKIQSVPIKYKDYVEVGEYDGYESVCINFDKYKLGTIQKILHDADTIDKVQAIQYVLDEPDNI
jgi:hypothetical protein